MCVVDVILCVVVYVCCGCNTVLWCMCVVGVILCCGVCVLLV